MPRAQKVNLSPNKSLGYHAFRGLLNVIWRLMFRPTIVGAENIPATGPVLIAPIHRSNIDFAFIIFVTKRKTFFMAKDSLWKVPVLRSLISTMGAFPVKRGTADRESLNRSLEVLQAGQALVLFPEGTRQEGDDVQTLMDGAMFIAARAGAKVVPVGIGHTERAMPRGAKFPRTVRVTLVVGEPIEPPSGDARPSRSAITASTEELRRSLQDCYARAGQL